MKLNTIKILEVGKLLNLYASLNNSIKKKGTNMKKLVLGEKKKEEYKKTQKILKFIFQFSVNRCVSAS